MLKYFQYKIINHRQISTLIFPALIISDHIIQTVRKEAITLNIEDSCISCIDTGWSYQLARRMEKEKTTLFWAIVLQVPLLKQLQEICYTGK